MTKYPPIFHTKITPLPSRTARDLKQIARKSKAEYHLNRLQVWAKEVLKKANLPTSYLKSLQASNRVSAHGTYPTTIEGLAADVVVQVTWAKDALKKNDAVNAVHSASRATQAYWQAVIIEQFEKNYHIGSAKAAGSTAGGHITARRHQLARDEIFERLKQIRASKPQPNMSACFRQIAEERRKAEKSSSTPAAVRRLIHRYYGKYL